MSTVEVVIGDTFVVANEGTTFDEAQVTIDGGDPVTTIHVLWTTLFIHNRD